MKENKKFEVDELDNKGYKKERKVGKIIKGALAVAGTTVVGIVFKKGALKKIK